MQKHKILLTHSFKGGTGKTVVAINVVNYLVEQCNQRVLFIDGDLSAPSLEKVFPPKKRTNKVWTDFLEGKHPLEDTIYPTANDHLDVIYSPAPEIGKQFLTEKKQSWWVDALRRQLLSRETFFNDLKYDFVVIDNQNGISMNSANNITCSDIGFMILRPVTYGVTGSTHLIKEMLKTIHGIRERRDFLIWNQVPESSTDESLNAKISDLLRAWGDYFDQIKVKPIAKIYYDADLSISMLEENPERLLGVTNNMQSHIEKILKEAKIIE